MSDLPGGTLTFLLTDIEGSTRLWEQERAAMAEAMIRHDALFEAIVDRYDGVVVRPRGEGDSRFAVFQQAGAAVAAVAQFQKGMYAEHWPTANQLCVRAALHTGEAALRDGDYYGSTVNRCARLRSLAHGGQTLLSQTTAQLVWESLPEQVSLRDLGDHALRDLSRPERVYQLIVPGVRSEFPALFSAGRRPSNLPSQTTTFVGREREIEAVRRRLRDPAVRLVTLIGPGGAGKTRLAIKVAEEIREEFVDGAIFVPLSPIQELGLLIPAIAKSLGVSEVGSESVAESLQGFLRGKKLLLVLDNFDHLVAAAPQLAALLSDCPELKMLVTSRETLHIRGNQEFSVPQLSLPDLNRLPPTERLVEFEAIRLFLERARDIKPDFDVTVENAAAVAAIVNRLDGLPLAIELAAARIRLFSPQALLARLDRRLQLLTGGAVDLPARQQTLRATIAWSHDLLDNQERALFRRLSVFAGGFTFDAAEAVAQFSGTSSDEPGPKANMVETMASLSGDWVLELDVLNGLDSLVSKSLIRQMDAPQPAEEPRFRMLGTIREFGLEQLDVCAETEMARWRHAAFYVALAEAAEPALKGPDQGTWLERLEIEHNNLRAAIEWSIEANEVTIALQLAGAVWSFWAVRGYFAEGRQWLERALILGGDDRLQAKTLTGAGAMAWSQGDFPHAADCYTKALELYRGLGDASGIAFALNNLGVQSEAQGDRRRAIVMYQESLALHREQGNELGIAYALNNLGAVAWEQSDFDEAARLFEESLALRKKLGDHQSIADALYNLGEIAYYRHDYARATDLYRESLTLRRSLGSRWGAALCLAGLAAVAALQDQLERAAKLWGAAGALFEETGISLDASDRSRFDQVAEMLRDKMGESAFVSRWVEGGSMLEGEAIDYGLATSDLPDAAPRVTH